MAAVLSPAFGTACVYRVCDCFVSPTDRCHTGRFTGNHSSNNTNDTIMLPFEPFHCSLIRIPSTVFCWRLRSLVFILILNSPGISRKSMAKATTFVVHVCRHVYLGAHFLYLFQLIRIKQIKRKTVRTFHFTSSE